MKHQEYRIYRHASVSAGLARVVYTTAEYGKNLSHSKVVWLLHPLCHGEAVRNTTVYTQFLCRLEEL